MLKRILSLITAALLLMTMICVQSISAETKLDKQARFAEKVKAGIARLGTGRESLVEVKLRNKTKVIGYVAESSEDSFTVTNVKTGASTDVAYANVTQVRGHNLSTGAKIAIGIAIGVGIALIVLAIFLNCCTG